MHDACPTFPKRPVLSVLSARVPTVPNAVMTCLAGRDVPDHEVPHDALHHHHPDLLVQPLLLHQGQAHPGECAKVKLTLVSAHRSYTEW